MAKEAEITVPLGIPEIQVLKTEINKKGELIITIESTKKGTNCRWCGNWITKSHGHDQWVQVRHLPVFLSKIPGNERLGDLGDFET